MDAELSPHSPRHPPWEEAFLAALSLSGVVSLACAVAAVGRSTVYEHRSKSADFRERWNEALDSASDRAEAEALRRAVDGDRHPVIHNGKPVFVWRDSDGEIVPEDAEGATKVVLMRTTRSDLLLIFMLKALRPEKFRDCYEPSVLESSRDLDAEIDRAVNELVDLASSGQDRARQAEVRAAAAERKLAELATPSPD